MRHPSRLNTLIIGKGLFFILLLFFSLFTLPSYAADSITKNQRGEIYPTYPTPNYGSGVNKALIQRGEYLAKAGDCIACHTAETPGSKPFAGGLGIKTPFGTFYTPNITGDKETGIGKWSDDDFVRAMQKGIRPDGSYYYPVFPYPNFTLVSRDDLLAIKAYLMSIPAVKQPNKENDVPFPFSWRFLQLGWRILFFHEGEYQYDPHYSKQWNRGAYLVQGLGHCGMCHSPLNILGAEKKDYYLSGNFVDGYYAPNITQYGLKSIPVEEIEHVFTQDEMLKGAGKVGGPMAEVNHDSLKYLSEADLESIAVYLKTVKSKVPKASSGPVTADTGKKIYESYCAVCHTTGAAGAPKLGDAGDWDPRIKQGIASLDEHAINGINSMPPKGTCMTCSDAEIKAVVQYMVDQAKGGGTATAKTIPVSAVPQISMAQAKQIYETNCSVCHATGALGAPKVGDIAAWKPILAQNMDILFKHTIEGYKRMPPRGACIECSNAELQAAVKYMAQESTEGGDYSLW